MNYNKQINPKDTLSVYPAQLMYSRAKQIKSVVTRDSKNGIGGATLVSSGTVFVPVDNTAYERTIRYHEALHAAHTSKQQNKNIKDMLDQALEDARLHKYCSKSSQSEFTRARRDELFVALKDLRGAKRQAVVTPATALVTLRALAIITADKKIKPAHAKLLTSVINRFGETAKSNFLKALKLLANVDNWKEARKQLKQYFKSEFQSNNPPMPSAKQEKQEQNKNENEQSEPEFSAPPSLMDEDEINDFEEPESDESGESSEGDESDEEDKSEDSEEVESESDESSDTEDSEGSEGESNDSDSESEESSDSEPAQGGKGTSEDTDDSNDEDMASPQMPNTDKPRKESDPEVYTADLTPQIDKEQFEYMNNRHPLKLYIRRLDMGINRVKLSLGRRAPLPVTSGRKILARRLAGAMSNPSTRVFARQVSEGGFGTILIDASGSMSIPPATLNDFLAKAPALTLAFYNAPNDLAKRGSIFIYAANGYRASINRIGGYSSEIEDFGGGNVIDYHAMAWLIKQPAPHYIVTDQGWTGYWSSASAVLCKKLIDSKQLIVVRNLAEMTTILEEKQKNKR